VSQGSTLQEGDSYLGHDWDRDSLLDLKDHLWVRHAGNASVLADVSRDALKSHDCYSSCLLGNACLLNVDDVCTQQQGRA
jgi:hypothetical protein